MILSARLYVCSPWPHECIYFSSIHTCAFDLRMESAGAVRRAEMQAEQKIYATAVQELKVWNDLSSAFASKDYEELNAHAV